LSQRTACDATLVWPKDYRAQAGDASLVAVSAQWSIGTTHQPAISHPFAASEEGFRATPENFDRKIRDCNIIGLAVSDPCGDRPRPVTRPCQWLSRGRPLVLAMRWYFTAGFSTMPLESSSTMPRWISCQGVWLSGYL